MKNESRELVKDSMKDILISVFIVAIIFLSLYAYTQNWPPIVIVESGSMQHGSESHMGIIDTGDIVLVKKVYSEEVVVSYVEGRMSGYKRYGDYGDVIIYNYKGKAIIHRAMVYLRWSGSRWILRGFENRNYPFWLHVNADRIVIDNVGYAHRDVIIDLKALDPKVVGEEGFITMGDNNLAVYGSKAYDQNSENFIPICPKLVSYNMIKGVAKGEIPWFGALKLYFTHTNTQEIPRNTRTYLVLSILGIFALTFLGDYLIAHRESIKIRLKRIFGKSKE